MINRAVYQFPTQFKNPNRYPDRESRDSRDSRYPPRDERNYQQDYRNQGQNYGQYRDERSPPRHRDYQQDRRYDSSRGDYRRDDYRSDNRRDDYRSDRRDEGRRDDSYRRDEGRRDDSYRRDEGRRDDYRRDDRRYEGGRRDDYRSDNRRYEGQRNESRYGDDGGQRRPPQLHQRHNPFDVLDPAKDPSLTQPPRDDGNRNRSRPPPPNQTSQQTQRPTSASFFHNALASNFQQSDMVLPSRPSFLAFVENQGIGPGAGLLNQPRERPPEVRKSKFSCFNIKIFSITLRVSNTSPDQERKFTSKMMEDFEGSAFLGWT